MTMIASSFSVVYRRPHTTSARLFAVIRGWPYRFSVGSIVWRDGRTYVELYAYYRALQAQADAWLNAGCLPTGIGVIGGVDRRT